MEVKPVLVDTSSLLAYCKTNYAELLFENLKMSTSNVCNDEVKRQKSTSDVLIEEHSCRKYLELSRENKNPHTVYVEKYKSYVENQGEDTLEWIFEQNPGKISYVLLFDFKSIKNFEELKQDIGGDAINTRISLPNYAFELLRKRGKMTDDEYCKATYQMGVNEGWMKHHAQRFADISSVDCERFP